MVERRSYGSYNDGCAASHALDILGERWALIVVRELLLGPKRFGDLQTDIAGISASALTTRLRDLGADGVLTQRRLDAPSRVPVYELTPWGYQLEGVTTALSGWGAQSAQLPLGADMSPDTVILAMRAHARPLPVGADALEVELRVADHRHPSRPAGGYLMTATDSSFTIGKTGENYPEMIATDSQTLQRLIFGQTSTAAVVTSGQLTTTLAPDALNTLVSNCSLPLVRH